MNSSSSDDESTSSSKNEMSNAPKEPHDSEITSKAIIVEYSEQSRAWVATFPSFPVTLPSDPRLRPSPPFRPLPVLNVPTANEVAKNFVETADQFFGVSFRKPPLWRRLAAESFDFKLLIIISCLLKYWLYGSIVKIDFSGYSSNHMQNIFSENYDTILTKMHELIFVDLVHRFIVCVYEIFWLKDGATIGKILYHLKVIRADKLFHIRGQPNNVFAVDSVSDLGWKRAAHRSIIKNIFFPLLFPLNLFPDNGNHNKCAWDVMCGTVVVEDIQPFMCKRSELIPAD